MIDQMLNTLVFQSGDRLSLEFAQFDIKTLVDQVVQDFNGDKLGRTFAVKGKPLSGWWSRDVMYRALENLIDNAIKYGSKDHPISIEWRQSHGRMMLAVNNKGQPIPPASLESVFKVYERSVENHEGDIKGWGIGLAFVRSVAESRGGSIGVESTAEAGTTFTINIPIDARPFSHAPVLE